MRTSVVVGLAGMPGSGKSDVACALEQLFGYRAISMSALLVEAPDDPSRAGATRDRWIAAESARRRIGPTFLVQRAWDLTTAVETEAGIVIDGIRHLEECRFLAERADFVLAAFQRPPRLRYERLRNSRRTALFREDDQAVYQLDAHELRLGVGDVIAEADVLWFSTASEASLDRETTQAARVLHEYVVRREQLAPGIPNDRWSALGRRPS